MRPALYANLLPLLAASVASFTVACSANVSAPVDLADAEAATTASSLAVVVVERTAMPGDTAHAEAVARFVRMRSGAVDDDALRMVGANVDMPALGTCAVVSTLARAPRFARAVELVDVGSVTLESNGVATMLPARRLPDVADLVSGVVYARAADDDAMPARGRYDLKIAGSPDVAPFVMSGFAPGEPSDLRVAGHDTQKGAIVGLAVASPVELTWEPGAADDAIYVDLVSDSVAGLGAAPSSASSVRCLFADNGRAVLAPSAFGALEDGVLSIHRVHREPFRTRGVDAGEVRFDFARAVLFSRR